MTGAEGTQRVDNGADVIDSRDVIARIAYLRECRDAYPDDQGENGLALDEEESDELAALEALAAEASDYAADWEYGEALIRDSYFVEYAQELAEDIGAVNSDLDWPLSYIDWPAAADALRMDYTSVDFDGVTYWVR